MELIVESKDVYSDGGVPVTVKGIAQVKVQGKELAALRSASEMFLDKSEDEIKEIAKLTLDGHQRSMIASTTIENIFKNRHDFSKNVSHSAQAELIEMGLLLVSYTVQDISDTNGHLNALGEARTADVKAEMKKEVAIAESFQKKKIMEIDYSRDEKNLTFEQHAELMKLDFEKKEAERQKEIMQNRAKAEKAGEIRKAELDKLICHQKLEVEELEMERKAEIIAKEKIIKEMKLKDEIERQADFQFQQEIELAKAMAEKEMAEAKAQADKTKRLAEAQAEIIISQKEAEAEVLRKRAEAFAQFGNAAKLEMVLAILPRLTAEIAGPITDCKKITSISQDGSVGFSRITGEVFEVLEQVCDSVSHIAGQSLGNNDDSSGGPGSSHRKTSTESTIPHPTDRFRLPSSFGRSS